MADLHKFFPGLGKGMPPTLSAAVPGVLTSASKGTGNPSPAGNTGSQFPIAQQGTNGTSVATPLQTAVSGVDVTYTIRHDCVETAASKSLLKVSPISVMKNNPLDTFSGTRITDTDTYIAYALKKKPQGGIRMLQRKTATAAILLGHEEHVSCVRFSPNQTNMLASVAPDGKCIVWELKEDGGEIHYRTCVKLLAPFGDGEGPFHCIVWHPSTPGCFATARGTSVVVCDITSELWDKTQTTPAGIPLEEAGCFVLPCAGGKINDIQFSKSGSDLYTCSDDGAVRRFSMDDLRSGQNTTPSFVFSPFDGKPVHSIGFIHQATGELEGYVVSTGTSNQKLAILDANGKVRQQITFSFASDMSLRWSLDPTSKYIIVTNNTSDALLIVRLASAGADAIVQCKLQYPILCSSIRQLGDTLEMNCIQTKAIQTLKISLQKCFEAPSSGTPPQGPAPTLKRTGSELVSPLDILGGGATSNKANANGNQEERSSSRLSKPASQSVSSPNAPQHANNTSTQSAVVQSSSPESVMPANIDGILERHMHNLMEKLEEQAKRRAEEDKERQKLLLTALAKSMMSIPTTVATQVEQKLQSPEFIRKISSAVAENLKGTLKKEMGSMKDMAPELGKVLQSSLAKEQKHILDTMSANTSRLMSNAFREAFAENIVPAFDAGCQQVVAAINGGAIAAASAGNPMHIQGTPMPHAMSPVPGAHGPLPTDVVAQMQQVPAMPNQGRIQADQDILNRHQITPYLMKHDYEQALYIALCANNLEVPVATCRQIDRVSFFSNKPLPVSQGILLTLLQQLSVDLENEVDLKILWLNNIARVLDPNDPNIVKHAQGYLETLRENLKTLAPKFHSDQWNPTAIAYRDLVEKLS